MLLSGCGLTQASNSSQPARYVSRWATGRSSPVFRSDHGQHQVGDVGPEHDYVGDKDAGSGDPGSSLTRQPEPPALVLNEPSCYHFRVLDPGGSATLSATLNVATIGHCSHI
jgi:hypothetical protein